MLSLVRRPLDIRHSAPSCLMGTGARQGLPRATLHASCSMERRCRARPTRPADSSSRRCSGNSNGAAHGTPAINGCRGEQGRRCSMERRSQNATVATTATVKTDVLPEPSYSSPRIQCVDRPTGCGLTSCIDRSSVGDAGELDALRAAGAGMDGPGVSDRWTTTGPRDGMVPAAGRLRQPATGVVCLVCLPPPIRSVQRHMEPGA